MISFLNINFDILLKEKIVWMFFFATNTRLMKLALI